VSYPYWIGLLLPSGLSLVIAFLLMLVAPCVQSRYPRPKDNTSTWVREYIGLALSLILFFITWGFGIPATHRLNSGIARIIFQAIFIAGSFLLGITVFLFFCLLSREVRQKWIALVSKVCRLPGKRRRFYFTNDNDSHPVEQNIYMTQYDTKPTELDTKGVSPGAAEMSVNVTSDEVLFTNPHADDNMDEETKVDLTEVPDETDHSVTKL